MGIMEILSLLAPDSSNLNCTAPLQLKGLAAWINNAIEVRAMRLGGKENIYLIKPKKELTFRQLSIIVEQIRSLGEGLPLLIADDLNPKFRALFVKKRMPFVYKNQSLFFPELGLKLLDYKMANDKESKVIDSELSAFQLKILAGYLTGFLPDEDYNLIDLMAKLASYNYRCSKNKLSLAVKDMLNLGYLKAEGLGPNRRVAFIEKEEIWADLVSANVSSFFKTYETTVDVDDENAILSHESALARYSNLAEPRKARFALSRTDYKKLNLRSNVRNEQETIVDVFREPPELFSIDNRLLNPVELFFQLRALGDERIQLSLEDMLHKYDLNYPQGG